jgi:hypothetical protein
VIAASLLAVSLLAAPAPLDPATAPAAFAPALRRADEAVAVLQQKLQGRLGRTMTDQGPAAAVTVCRDDAPRLAAEVGAEHGVRLGRTSDRLRGAGNGAPGWAAAAVKAAAGRKAAEVRPQAFDLGDRVGVLKPIGLAPACTRCHGKPDALAADVTAALRGAYPADRATGYEAGDHRGFFWVEVPKAAAGR